MYRPRFTLRALLGLVSFVAVGCASLLRATPVVASIACGSTLLLLFATIPLCVYRTGERRAFWLGFALFGLGYYVIACGPWQPPGTDLQVTRLRARLPTTKLLDWIYGKLPTKPAPPGRAGGGMFQISGGMGGGMVGVPIRVPIVDSDDFALVGHALWSMVLALAGAAFTRGCQRSGAMSAGKDNPI